MSTGRIFDVKEFAIHDGPGARITFFLKGCPLRCPWCHNPEGLSRERELMVRTALCTQCGACRIPADTDEFRRYGRNPAACPKGLITLCGTDTSPQQVLERVLPLKEMLALAEGGVTFSGGEPLMQHEFLEECLILLRENGIHTAIETCGYAKEEIFRRITDLCDYVMMDLKYMDEETHRRILGVSNRVILANAAHLKGHHPAFVFRTPKIPGYTDTDENLAQIKAFVGDAPWEILPYNTLAGAKYPMLNKTYPLKEGD